MKVTSPQVGFNNNIRHRGLVFHVQTEDSGLARPHIITHLFAHGGQILKTTKVSYAELVDDEDVAKRVRSLMKEQHKAMLIALRDGEFDALFAGAAEATHAAAASADPTSTTPTNPTPTSTTPTSAPQTSPAAASPAPTNGTEEAVAAGTVNSDKAAAVGASDTAASSDVSSGSKGSSDTASAASAASDAGGDTAPRRSLRPSANLELDLEALAQVTEAQTTDPQTVDSQPTDAQSPTSAVPTRTGSIVPPPPARIRRTGPVADTLYRSLTPQATEFLRETPSPRPESKAPSARPPATAAANAAAKPAARYSSPRIPAIFDASTRPAADDPLAARSLDDVILSYLSDNSDA
jgi:hypothetical protein